MIVTVELAIPHKLHGGTMTGEGWKVTVGLEGPDGVTVAVRGRGPENRLDVFIVMVALTAFPGRVVMVFGFELSEKSGDTPCNLHAVSGCSSQPE